MSLMNIQPRQLHAFLEVCRLQSFSKAAERIPMSQSGISMLVKELESDVGARLFDRTTRSVVPTAVGRKLQAHATRVLAEFARFDESLVGDRQALASRLNVAATPTVSANLLATTLGEFAISHPQVSVSLDDGEVGSVRKAVLEGRVDLGLGFFIEPTVGLKRAPICPFRLMLVSPGVSTRKKAATRTWASLASLPLISLPAGNPIQSLIETHLKPVGRAHEQRPTMNFVGTLVAMVEAGLGHAVLPSFALPDCLRRDVTVAMLTDPAVSIDLHCATRHGAETSAVAADFMAALARVAARKPG